MKIRFNATKENRKHLAETIAEASGSVPRYLQAPTFAYKVGEIIIDCEGTMEVPKGYDGEKLVDILTVVVKHGFEGTVIEENSSQEELPEAEGASAKENVESESTQSVGLTVELPHETVAVGNLMNLLQAKGKLIQKALGSDNIHFEIDDDKIAFPWFTSMPDRDHVQACTAFIAAICKLSKETKRTSAKEKEVTNEKYAFRCFLLRLGMIGDEYKAIRNILLQNLEGSAAFKNGCKKEAVQDEISE